MCLKKVCCGVVGEKILFGYLGCVKVERIWGKARRAKVEVEGNLLLCSCVL